ncbi:MAG TPA: hypothetical protein ENI95_10990 [Chloroflexi bacterium]|nr:hypothetical protein [Chloroflexota bacterium]
MTWTDPTTRQTGDLITAAIWNGDVVDNLSYLHDRVVTRYFWPANVSQAFTAFGDHPAALLNSSQGQVYCPLNTPEDFDSLVAAEIVLVTASDTANWPYALYSDYGAASTGDYNAYDESLIGQSKSLTGNRLETIDVSGVLSNLGASMVAGVKITTSSVTNIYVLGLVLRYTRT